MITAVHLGASERQPTLGDNALHANLQSDHWLFPHRVMNRNAAFRTVGGEPFECVCVLRGWRGCRVSNAAPFSTSLSENIICAFSDSPGSYAACKFISLIIRAGGCPGGLMASFLMHRQPPGPQGYYPPLTWKNCVSSTEKTPGYLSCATI